MAEETLKINAEDHHKAYLRGESEVPWALSVFAHATESVDYICRRAWPILRHNKIRVSTAGELRELGYEVIPDGQRGHCLIPLDPPPWEWQPLRDIGFEPERENPERRRRREQGEV